MLTYPITARKVILAFPELGIDEESVQISQDFIQEVCVNGTWTETKLRRVFNAAGLKPVDDMNNMTFCNDDSTIGVVCYGIGLDEVRTNRFKTYCFEIQARSMKQVEKGISPAAIF